MCSVDACDMVGIDIKVTCHALKFDRKIKSKIQMRWPMSGERCEALKNEVDRLL